MQAELFCFGGVNYAIECEQGIEPSAMCEPFRAPAGEPDHVIRLSFSSTLPRTPDDAYIYGTMHRWYSDGARHSLVCCSADEKNPQFTYAVTKGDKTELIFSESYRASASVRAVFESVCLFDLLADAGMLILHSSFVLTHGGNAILFSGPSGIGKSTQAALWEKYAAAEVVNGDRTLVRLDNLTANGVFYSGTSGICKNISAPLKAVILLGRGEKNDAYTARPREAFARILSQCAYYQWDAVSAVRMTDYAARLASAVPILNFDCTADESAVRALQNKLEGII